MDSGLKVGLRPKSKTNESFLREDSSAPVNGMLPRENKAARRQRRRDGHGQLEDEVAEQNLTTKLFGNLGDEPLVEKSWVASTAGCGEDGGGAGAEVGDASARVAVGWEIAAPPHPRRRAFSRRRRFHRAYWRQRLPALPALRCRPLALSRRPPASASLRGRRGRRRGCRRIKRSRHLRVNNALPWRSVGYTGPL